MKKFEVLVTARKVVFIYASDAGQAMDTAEKILNHEEPIWNAEAAELVDNA